MKGYPCVFKFPEYGNLWFCDDPDHEGKCAMSKLQTYIPRGVIVDGVCIVIFPDIVYYILRIYTGGRRRRRRRRRKNLPSPHPHPPPRKKYPRKGFPSLRYILVGTRAYPCTGAQGLGPGPRAQGLGPKAPDTRQAW